MTEAQEAHALSIGDRIHAKIIKKYALGAKEHGGNLWENHPLDMIDFAIDEVTDLGVYLLTLRDQLVESVELTEGEWNEKDKVQISG